VNKTMHPQPRSRSRAKPNAKTARLAGSRRAPGVRGRRPLPDFEADARRIFGQASQFGDVLLGKYGDSIL